MKFAAGATDWSLTISITELLKKFLTIIYFHYSLTRELRNTFLPQLKVAQIILSDIIKDSTECIIFFSKLKGKFIPKLTFPC